MTEGESPPGLEMEKAASDKLTTQRASAVSDELIAQGQSQRNGNGFGPLRKGTSQSVPDRSLKRSLHND
jgi:hypothetical protein